MTPAELRMWADRAALLYQPVFRQAADRLEAYECLQKSTQKRVEEMTAELERLRQRVAKLETAGRWLLEALDDQKIDPNDTDYDERAVFAVAQREVFRRAIRAAEEKK